MSLIQQNLTTFDSYYIYIIKPKFLKLSYLMIEAENLVYDIIYHIPTHIHGA